MHNRKCYNLLRMRAWYNVIFIVGMVLTGYAIPDIWESANGLSPQNANDATEDPDGDGLINLHEYWASCNPGVYDGSNTLLSVCAQSVDSRLVGKDPATALTKFENFQANGTNFVLNTAFWADDIDTSCASMWNDSVYDIWGGDCFQWNKAGTAISKRHIITAWHYAIPTGTTIQQAIDSLCPGYTLEEIDLSGYEALRRGE